MKDKQQQLNTAKALECMHVHGFKLPTVIAALQRWQNLIQAEPKCISFVLLCSHYGSLLANANILHLAVTWRSIIQTVAMYDR